MHQANAPEEKQIKTAITGNNIIVCQGNKKEDDLFLTWKTGEQHGIRCNLANPFHRNCYRLA
jgi:hypothetical protein